MYLPHLAEQGTCEELFRAFWICIERLPNQDAMLGVRAAWKTLLSLNFTYFQPFCCSTRDWYTLNTCRDLVGVFRSIFKSLRG